MWATRPAAGKEDKGRGSAGLSTARTRPYHCLFCFTKPGARVNFRRLDGLRKHYAQVHFKYQTKEFVCPVIDEKDKPCGTIIKDIKFF